MKTPFKFAAAALGLVVLAGAAGSASAYETRWQAHHPRREEVNGRLMHQSRRIGEERREGDLTRGQAHELRAEDRGIRAQERFDASHHHGHLTRTEQRQLNHEENGVSRQIGR